MKKTILSAVILLAGASVWAQNLNPTVEVTNTYAREATGIEKPSQLLEMPDSVLRFNLDMDYSVNPTPYQGSYEFKPYLVQLRPQLRPSNEGTLFVRAGAGYGLHPEATVVWTPVKKEHLRLNLFGDHSSYIGQYRNVALDGGMYVADGTFRNGKEMRSALGADALYTWTGGALAADVQYKNVLGTGIMGGDASHNIGQLRARVKSAPGTAMAYEAGTRLAYIGVGDFREFHTVTDGSLGTRFGVHNVRLGLLAETVGQGDNFVGNVALTPHYMLNTGKFHMDLGVKVSFLFRSDPAFCPHPGGVVFPDVRISFDLAQDVAVLYAAATGGDQIISYDKLLSLNPFMADFGWHTDNQITRVNACLGVRGNIAERFHYDLKGGYRWDENAWTWGRNDIRDVNLYSGMAAPPYMDYASPLHTFYVDLNAGFNNEILDIGTHIYYGHTPIPDLGGRILFAPAPFKAQAHAFYIWGSRVKAGLTLDARSKLPGKEAIPGYVDLGLEAQLQMTSRLGFWLKGGNLLNQTIQRVPFYAQKGIYFTVGVTLSL